MTGAPEFDWDDVADQVVQQSVEKVAIYANPDGDIAIRQGGAWDEEGDRFIVISQAHALTAAYAILDAAGLGDICFHRHVEGGYVDVPIQASVAAMMAARPDIDWKAVNEDINEMGLSDEREEERDEDDSQKPKDPTAAERQRRCRQKRRDGEERDVTSDVTRDVTAERDTPLLIAAE